MYLLYSFPVYIVVLPRRYLVSLLHLYAFVLRVPSFHCIFKNSEEKNKKGHRQKKRKKEGTLVIFFKEHREVDAPLAGGPLDRKPTLRRADLEEI